MKKPFPFSKIVLAVFLALFLLGMIFFPKPGYAVKGVFLSFSSVFQKPLWDFSGRIKDFFLSFERKAELLKENEDLWKENQELVSRIVLLEEKEKENQSLKQVLGVEQEIEFKLVIAQAIAKDISQDVILVDQGKKEGISLDAPVISETRALVGKVCEVYEHHAKVCLITNKNIAFDAKVKDVLGIAKGSGGGKVLLTMIPKNKEIRNGDQIITVSAAGLFPSGILVGQIDEVFKNDVEAFDYASIKTLFSIKDLDTVFIITDY